MLGIEAIDEFNIVCQAKNSFFGLSTAHFNTKTEAITFFSESMKIYNLALMNSTTLFENSCSLTNEDRCFIYDLSRSVAVQTIRPPTNGQHDSKFHSCNRSVVVDYDKFILVHRNE